MTTVILYCLLMHVWQSYNVITILEGPGYHSQTSMLKKSAFKRGKPFSAEHRPWSLCLKRIQVYLNNKIFALQKIGISFCTDLLCQKLISFNAKKYFQCVLTEGLLRSSCFHSTPCVHKPLVRWHFLFGWSTCTFFIYPAFVPGKIRRIFSLHASLKAKSSFV